MNRFGKWTTALMVVGAAVGTVSVASAAVIQTRISLDDFKRALGVRSVGTLMTQTPIAGIKFWINKNTGTVTFRVNTSVYDGSTPIAFATSSTVKGQTGRSIVGGNLFADFSRGVYAVRGNAGTVSPT